MYRILDGDCGQAAVSIESKACITCSEESSKKGLPRVGRIWFENLGTMGSRRIPESQKDGKLAFRCGDENGKVWKGELVIWYIFRQKLGKETEKRYFSKADGECTEESCG